MKLFSKKNITIYTIIILLLSMLTFEIGYCNPQIITKEGAEYNFSLCRIVVYIVFITLYVVFHKKFVETALQTTENKFKRVLIYLAIILGIVTVCIILIYSTYIESIRAGAIASILCFLSTLFVIYISNDTQKNIIVTACTFGIIFTFTTNFNHAIDEKKHFMSALNISFLNFDYVENPITDNEIEKLPQLTKFTQIDEFLKNDYEPDITNEVDKEDTPSTPANYNVLTYIFPALGIAIARILNGSIIDMYILGRIMNLVIYTILVYIALKILPYKKNIFFVIAFMPYMLLLATSYSVDGICLGTIYIFTAYCFKLYKECETLNLKQLLILLALFLIMLIGKGTGYILIGVLVFMLPLYKTIKKNKKYLPQIITAGIIFAILVTLFVIYMKNTKINSDGDNRGQGTINAVEQLEMVLTHPIYDVKIALEHIKRTLLNFNWLAELYQGTFFNGNENSANVFLVMMLFVLYVALTEEDHNFKIKEKIILLLAFFLGYGMTSAIMYLSFTAVGELHIAGYQPRYLFPILPLLLCCLSGNYIKTNSCKNRTLNINICSGIFLGIGLIQVILG